MTQKCFIFHIICRVVLISLKPDVEYSNTVDINRLVKSVRSSKLFNSKSFYFFVPNWKYFGLSELFKPYQVVCLIYSHSHFVRLSFFISLSLSLSLSHTLSHTPAHTHTLSHYSQFYQRPEKWGKGKLSTKVYISISAC